MAGVVYGEGEGRGRGRKAKYVNLVVGTGLLHLFLTPLCRFEMFLNKNFEVKYIQQNSNTTVKSLLPIPKFLPSPAPPPFPTPRLSQLQRIRCTSDKNKQVCVLIARRGWGLCLRSQEVKEGHDA